MTHDEIRKTIYNRYIRPTERPKTGRVGIELEFPVVNCRLGGAVDFTVIHRLIDTFTDKFGFTEISRDDEGNIFSASDKSSRDNISCDCSYNTIELSFGVDSSLCDTYKRFNRYYDFIQEFLLTGDHMITGMGINPSYKANRIEPIPNGRYRMLLHHLKSYTRYTDEKDFHNIPHFGLISCASQIHLDAQKDSLIEELNTFTRIEPLKAILFANSPFGEYTCARDYFWMHSLHGLNPHNVNILEEEVHGIDDLVDYISSLSIYCVERGSKYVNFRPTVLRDYFQRQIITGEYYDHNSGSYREIDIKPELSDIQYLRSFKFDDLTFRGTIEFRSVCEQPAGEIMAQGAFQTGLAEKLPEVTDFITNECHMYGGRREATDYRQIFIRKGFIRELDLMSGGSVIKLPYDDPGHNFTKNDLRSALLRLLEISSAGLKSRGFGEEKFLAPLYKRAEALTSPAYEMLKGLAGGRDLKYYIENFAAI